MKPQAFRGVFHKFATFVAAMLSISSAAAAEITLFSFEDGTGQGWLLNDDWGKGFTKVETVGVQATDGSKSLELTFEGQSYKWGAFALNLNDPALLAALQHGGKLTLDLVIPEASDGIQHLGFSFQQANVAGALGWQQIWFAVSGATGRFKVELPVERSAQGAVSFHLGQNAPAGKTYAVYVDNLRVTPNPPPPQGEKIERRHTLFSFEDGSADGFEVNSAGWGLAFTTVENSESETGATDGRHSLKATFPAGEFKWGAYANNIVRPDILSALSENGTLLVDVTIPDEVTGIQHLGVALSQPGAANGKDWQQTWLFVGGRPGRYTIDVPFTRENERSINLNLGRNSTGDTDATVYLDHVRVVATEIVAARPGTVRAVRNGEKVRIEFTGSLASAPVPVGPFQTVVGAVSPLDIDPRSESGAYFRAQGQPVIYFSDDFEKPSGWTARYVSGVGEGPAWDRGTPDFPEAITFVRSGTNAFATSLLAPYSENVISALTSPVIDLNAEKKSSRLVFYDFLDAGGVEGDADKVEVFVRSESGGVLTGAANAIWTGKRQSSGPYFYSRRVADLPAVTNGKKIRLEFRLTSDGVGGGTQKGWIVDDVSVYARP